MTDPDTDFCDYCADELYQATAHAYMRAVGWSEINGTRLPLAKTWCGICKAPDDIDPEASAAMWKGIR